MSSFSSILDDACHIEGFQWMDLVSVGHYSHADASSALAMHAIVAIPDIYGNNAILKQDPARAYGSAAENFTPRLARKVNMAV